jgi:hypothetical protein
MTTTRLPDVKLTHLPTQACQHVIRNGTYHFAHPKPGDDIA